MQSVPSAPAAAASSLSGPHSAAASSASSDAMAAELKHHQHCLHQVVKSAELATMLLSVDGGTGDMQKKCHAIAQAVLEDAAACTDGQKPSALNLNQTVGGSGCLLVAFSDAMEATNVGAFNPRCDRTMNEYQARAAIHRFGRSVLATAVPRICELIRASFDVGIQHNGWNALGWLAIQVQPYDAQDPCIQLAAALIDRGYDVNARRADDGATPLMAWSKAASGDGVGTGALLLLERGADLDTRDHNGWTAVHWMAHNSKLLLLRALTQNGWLDKATLELTNNDGRTALQLAQAAQWGDLRRREVCDLLRVGQQVVELARPLKFKLLTEVLLIDDLAHSVMSFVDGKERGQ